MLEWRKREDVDTDDHPMRSAASAARLLAGMRSADPLGALNELSEWLETLAGLADLDDTVRSEILAQIEEAGGAHVSALLAQFIARPAGRRGASAVTWKALSGYLTALRRAMHRSARALLKRASRDRSLQLAAATDAARCLQVFRVLAKACLIRYLDVPPKVWRRAYGLHDAAEKAGCAALPVRVHASQKNTTTVTHELLRLLMLQSSAPEMMAPEQIEVADRVIGELGHDFTLRPPGIADNPFRFDPSSERPPRRARAQPQAPDAEARYFGAGAGFEALERLYKQLGTSGTGQFSALGALGKDIAPHAQISAIRHLLAFWGPSCPYTPPERSAATGELRVVHRYAQVWQDLSRTGITELTLADDHDAAPDAAAETWTLRHIGGNELGADLPPASRDWARCGDLLAVSTSGKDEAWLAMIRSMHAESDGRLRANIAIVSRDPQAVQLRLLVASGEDNAYSEQAARQFAFNATRAIILSDGSEATHKPNFLLPPESWKPGAVYEATVDGAPRQLRGAQLLRRGDDYVRATFEWVAQT